MLKRQDTFLSSSRRETPPPNQSNHHAKSVGCMSGIFHLLSKYQHRHRRKFLTFGKKHDKVAEQPPSAKRDRTNNHMLTKKEDQNRDGSLRLVTSHYDVVRKNSANQPEIRRSRSVDSRVVEIRSSPALLPRLMGLQESPPGREGSEHKSFSSISWEERRKLISDLEKCDEDLKELKRIIESVRNKWECVRSPSPLPSVVVKRAVVIEEGGGNEKINTIISEQPSPVSVLDELTRSPLIRGTYSKRETLKYGGRTALPQLQKATPKRKPGEDDDTFDSLFIHKTTVESVEGKHEMAALQRPWSSKAMIQSVEEVCNEIGCGEKREVGRIGLVMQHSICTDLIEEFVSDLLTHSTYGNISSLPFTSSCRRKLCF